MRFLLRLVSRLVKWILKWLFAFALLATIFFIVANYTFHHWYPIRQKVQASVKASIETHHVHPLSYAEIPLAYRDAVIATEDRRFSWDPGFDPVGILRSVIVDVEQDGYVEGGSTIAQQLADNTLLNHQKTLMRKIEQLVVAVGIYDTFSKPETLAMYANVIYFGHGAYGLYNAAETYFGRTPAQCNTGELAMLAGLPNAPSVYDPFRNLALARQRQQIVIHNMVDAGKLSPAEAKQILAEPIRLRK